jgi:hypothetical protein
MYTGRITSAAEVMINGTAVAPETRLVPGYQAKDGVDRMHASVSDILRESIELTVVEPAEDDIKPHRLSWGGGIDDICAICRICEACAGCAKIVL